MENPIQKGVGGIQTEQRLPECPRGNDPLMCERLFFMLSVIMASCIIGIRNREPDQGSNFLRWNVGSTGIFHIECEQTEMYSLKMCVLTFVITNTNVKPHFNAGSISNN